MATSDVRDILQISRPAPGAEGTPKKSTKPEKEKKPEGISRELFQLIGGAPPVAFTKPTYKQKPNLRQKAAHWELREFVHPGRTDQLALLRWTKDINNNITEDDLQEFQNLEVIHYTDEEYHKYLLDRDWTKEETDYLFDLYKRYDGRFMIIYDRYDFPGKRRTMEDLKDRFYFVQRKIIQQRPGQDKAEIAKYNYDKNREVDRKRNLCMLFTRTSEQIKEEEALLEEYERIEQNEKKFAKEREVLIKSLAFQDISTTVKRKRSMTNGSSTPATEIVTPVLSVSASESLPKKSRRASASSVGSSTVVEAHPPVEHVRREKLPPGVIVRSQKIPQVKQGAITKVTKYLQEAGLGIRPSMPTENVCAKWIELQKAIVSLHDLKRHVEKQEHELKTKKQVLEKTKAAAGGSSNSQNW